MQTDVPRTKLVCDHCSEMFYKRTADYDAKKRIHGKNCNFYCGLSCAAKARAPAIKYTNRRCKYCKERFRIEKKSKTVFCSRGCASAGSVTKYRRRIAIQSGIRNAYAFNTPEAKSASLRTRESPKYVGIHRLLKANGVKHKFEYPLKDTKYVFDLCIKSSKLLVEFDSCYHKRPYQKQTDKNKDRVAKKQGWNIVRISHKKQTLPINKTWKTLAPLLEL